jgi:small-conductance mechanosensitive channel
VDGSVQSGRARTGPVAIAVGIVAIATFVSLLLFFAIGGPFGAINDAGNGLIGILSGTLAIVLHRRAKAWVALAAALIGAVVAVLGTWLVMTDTTGFLLAGFVSTVGFGLIGFWLGLIAWSDAAAGWPSRMRQLARIAAVCMVAGGVVALPGALMGIDAYDAVPPWLWLFGLGWLGTYVLYPAWSLSFGRRPA